jgi:hypothetical protein
MCLSIFKAIVKMTVTTALNRDSMFTAINRSAAQPNVVKENSADRQPVVQLTSPKAGTLEVSRRVQIKLHLISKI